jgi:hypothetical protein
MFSSSSFPCVGHGPGIHSPEPFFLGRRGARVGGGSTKKRSSPSGGSCSFGTSGTAVWRCPSSAFAIRSRAVACRSVLASIFDRNNNIMFSRSRSCCGYSSTFLPRELLSRPFSVFVARKSSLHFFGGGGAGGGAVVRVVVGFRSPVASMPHAAVSHVRVLVHAHRDAPPVDSPGRLHDARLHTNALIWVCALGYFIASRPLYWRVAASAPDVRLAIVVLDETPLALEDLLPAGVTARFLFCQLFPRLSFTGFGRP